MNTISLLNKDSKDAENVDYKQKKRKVKWDMFMKGNYDLKRAIEALEDYMRASGMTSDHRIEGGIHHFIIQHNLGIKWSLFTEYLLKQIFHQFLPNLAMQCKTTPNTTIASIALGSEFSEHDY